MLNQAYITRTYITIHYYSIYCRAASSTLFGFMHIFFSRCLGIHGMCGNPSSKKKTTVESDSFRSSDDRVVKLLACGAIGPGFDSRPHHLNFQRFVISCFQVEIWLKDRYIDANPQNNQPTNLIPLEHLVTPLLSMSVHHSPLC